MYTMAFFAPSAYSQTTEIPFQPLSYLADKGCTPCFDTVKFLWEQRVFDLSLLLPEWNPVVDFSHYEVLEGTVQPVTATYVGCHVSPEDFSGYHYTHDFGFDVVPDSGFDRICARRTYSGFEIDHPTGKPDTVLQRTMHVEWESGLGASNRNNPCTSKNCIGQSNGFFSAGHQRGDIIWNWPTIGDWVHVEGLWIWDRGHPPARIELHPLRLCATRRALPVVIVHESDSILATKIDVFASGDGGALNNNREGVPAFVHRVRMSEKDYTFQVKPLLPRPSPTAILQYRIDQRAGDTFKGGFIVRTSQDDLSFRIKWKGQPDDAVVARTIYCWWREPGSWMSMPLPEMQRMNQVHRYAVHFERLYFNLRKDVLSRPEKVIWLEAGGQYLCLNEFTDAKNVMRKGEARTYRREWNIDQTLIVYAAAGQSFRVHATGWENDGLSLAYGDLIDPAMPCTRETIKAMHRHLWPATPFSPHGCLDDLIGEVHDFYRADTLPAQLSVESKSDGEPMEYEQCPGANTMQKDVFRLWYSIRRLD